MTTVALKRSRVSVNTCTSGYLIESKSFKWEVDNFREVIATPGDLTDLKITFEAGETIGIPSKWVLYLKRQEKNFLGLYLALLESPKEDIQVFAKFGYEMLGHIGSDESPKDYKLYPRGMGFESIGQPSDSISDCQLVDGSLPIIIQFTLFKEIGNYSDNSKRPKLAE